MNVQLINSNNIEFGLKKIKRNSMDKELDEAAQKWVFETNGHKWSNNDDTAGDNYGSFIAGADWQAKRMYSEEEVKLAYNEGQVSIISANYIRTEEWFEQFKKK
jgi:hypothetical protein